MGMAGTFFRGGGYSSKFGGGLPKCRAANQHCLAGERVCDGVGEQGALASAGAKAIVGGQDWH
jgi:hypothetical protein